MSGDNIELLCVLRPPSSVTEVTRHANLIPFHRLYHGGAATRGRPSAAPSQYQLGLHFILRVYFLLWLRITATLVGAVARSAFGQLFFERLDAGLQSLNLPTLL